MKKILTSVLMLLSFSVSGQNQTTPNLLVPSVNGWAGTVAGQNAGYSGGSTPAYNAATDTIIFGYTQATAAQTIAINNALSGSGVQVGGYSYSWQINNSGSQSGTLQGTVALKNSSGQTIQSYNYNYNDTNIVWQTYSGTQMFPSTYALPDLSTISLSWTGKDNRFWAGYYGPQVRAPSLSLVYTVDPCATNPAYSPSCANFNTVTTSDNLFTGYTGTQAYAINQALATAGSGAMIHGFDYGYNYNVAGRQCSFIDLFGFCITGWNYSDAGVATVITNNSDQTIYSQSNTHNGGDNGTSGTYSKQLRFNSSLPMATMGGFAMSSWTSGNATINNMYSRAVYTVDPCVSNPLYSTTCSGYQQAYLEQQCSSNPLYSTSCAGYQQAYHDQQCSANPLYAVTCVGYQVAYKAQQCSLNPLYATDCPGYETAYKNQQCSINPLYATDCPGYATAYKTQQCTLNPLYATDCPGYKEAYFKDQCLKDSLYDKNCEGYSTAYAIKYLVALNPAVTTAVNQQLTNTVEVQKNDPANVVSTTGNSTTDSVLSTPSTTSATSTTSVTSVVNKPSTSTTTTTAQQTNTSQTNTTTVAAKQEEKKQEEKKTETQVSSIEKKSGGNKEEAKKGAEAKAKELANDVSKAQTIEQQKAVQGVLVGVMNYVPGFNAYQNSIVPDVNVLNMTRQYSKPVIDNRSALRRLSGSSDARWQEMTDSQYQLGK